MVKNKNVFELLNLWSDEYLNNKRNLVTVSFSKDCSVGHGVSEHDINNNHCTIRVGINPIQNSFFMRNQIIDNLTFVKIGITMYHEFEHYEQLAAKHMAKDILIANLSNHNCLNYYNANWNQLPHEIDAEYAGVMNMWSKLEHEFPENANEWMLNHISARANRYYMFEHPAEGFQSKEQIESLFETAYDKSLMTKRELSSSFLRSDDEIAQLLTDENHNISIEYQPFYHQIQTSETGQEMDMKMASLISYIHPELQSLYKSLDFEELNPVSVFGIPMPETKEEILNRIDVTPKCIALDMISEKEFDEAVKELETLTTHQTDCFV